MVLLMSAIQEITAPFFLQGAGERASAKIILVHGFTGSPLEFRKLALFLNEHGYTVIAVRLPGHGTCIKDMAKTRWSDWWKHLMTTYDEINSKDTKNIVTIGHSMGGLLTLKLATVKKIDGTICLSTPIFIQKRIAFAEVLGQWLRKSTPKSIQVNGESFYYEKPPICCLFSLWLLLNHVKGLLPQVNTPIFISQGRSDLVVQPRSADYIYRKTSSAYKSIRYYPNSSHAILLDSEHNQVHNDIFQFIKLIIG